MKNKTKWTLELKKIAGVIIAEKLKKNDGLNYKPIEVKKIDFDGVNAKYTNAKTTLSECIERQEKMPKVTKVATVEDKYGWTKALKQVATREFEEVVYAYEKKKIKIPLSKINFFEGGAKYLTRAYNYSISLEGCKEKL